MPVKTFRVSNLSGDIIPDNTGARVRVLFADGSRADMRADLKDEEVAKLVKAYKLEEVETRPERRAARQAR